MRGGVELIREVFGSDSDSDDADELNHPGLSSPAPLMRPGCVVETPAGDGARNPGIVRREGGAGEDARRWLLDSIRADDLVDFPDDEPSTAGSDRCAPTGGGRNQAMRFGRDHLPRWALALADAVAKLATTRPGVSKGVSLSPHGVGVGVGGGRRRRRHLPPRGAGTRAHAIRRLQSDDRQPVRTGRRLGAARGPSTRSPTASRWYRCDRRS